MRYQQTLAERYPYVDGSNCLCYMPVFPNKLGLWSLFTPVYYSKCQESQSAQYISSWGCTAGQQWTQYSEICDIVGRGININVGKSNTCFGRHSRHTLVFSFLSHLLEIEKFPWYSIQQKRKKCSACLQTARYCKVSVFSQPLFPLSGSFSKLFTAKSLSFCGHFALTYSYLDLAFCSGGVFFLHSQAILSVSFITVQSPETAPVMLSCQAGANVGPFVLCCLHMTAPGPSYTWHREA